MRVAVIIPTRERTPPLTTISALSVQTYRDMAVAWSYDEGRGKSWATNRLIEQFETDSEFLLLSDDDIKWYPRALANMVACLDAHQEAAYCYGYFLIGEDDVIRGGLEFDADRLRNHNYISWNSLVRRKFFPGCDESLRRLIDYDVWLTMLEHGHVGVSCQRLLFTTDLRKGITYQNDDVSIERATEIVHRKHGLWKEAECQE